MSFHCIIHPAGVRKQQGVCDTSGQTLRPACLTASPLTRSVTLSVPLSPSEPPLPHGENAGLDHNCGFQLLSEVLRDFSPENPQGATWGAQEPPIIAAVGPDPLQLQ